MIVKLLGSLKSKQEEAWLIVNVFGALNTTLHPGLIASMTPPTYLVPVLLKG